MLACATVRFRNDESPQLPPGFGAVFKWAVIDRVLGRRRRTPRRAPVPVVEPDRTVLASAGPALTWVGHATWLVQLGGHRVLTDPVWSAKLGPGIHRNVAPGLALDEARPTVVVVSHNHRDHLDAPTIARLGPEPTYVVPAALGHFFRKRGCPRVVELDRWQSTDLDGLRVTLVPSQHWSQRGLLDRNDTLWGGFVLEGDGKRVYFAGDTAYFGGFRAIGERFPSLDAALLPIGAYEPAWFMRRQHMGPDDALRAFADLGARLLCAMHWGTFKLTDEDLLEPPAMLDRLRREGGVAAEAVWVAAIGETRAL